MELRFPCLRQTFQHAESRRPGLTGGVWAPPTPPPGSNASFFYPASCRPGPLPGPPGTTVSLGSEWGLVCCQPGQHLLPTPSPVTGAGWGGARGGARGRQGGCLGRAGDQAGVELRVGPSLPLLVWNCRVHGPGLGLGSSVNPHTPAGLLGDTQQARCPCQPQE